jgi:ribosomal protein S6--L-glutamate ligase
VLTREPKGSAGRIADAIAARGHTVKVLGTYEVTLELSTSGLSLVRNQEPLKTYDAVLARVGHSATSHGAMVLRQFELMGVPVFPRADALVASRDKLIALQRLAAAGIPIPQTSFVRRRKDLGPTIARLGAPLIVKVLEGTQGRGVLLAETARGAEAIAEALLYADRPVLLQKFIAESRGRDVRAFVVGGGIVAAVRRVAKGDEYRSNVHLGASAEPVDLPASYARVAVDAARVLGLPIAGVDVLEGKDGPVVVEVNSSPGVVGIEEATRADVAGAIAQWLEREVYALQAKA